HGLSVVVMRDATHRNCVVLLRFAIALSVPLEEKPTVRCEECGREIHSGDESFSTFVYKHRFRERWSPAGNSDLVSVTLCGDCYIRRDRLPRLVWRALWWMIGGMIFVSLLFG